MKRKLVQLIKSAASNIPPAIGTRISRIPFKYRLGSSYSRYKSRAGRKIEPSEMFNRVKLLVEFAEKHIPFYQEFYRKHGFSSAQLNGFEDLALIPIVTKNDLQACNFAQRVLDANRGIVTNTGGTSGKPLKLLLDDEAYAREWAHMHSIWEQLDYKTQSIKLTVRGMNLGDVPLHYNFIHNEFQVNAYCDFKRLVTELDAILEKYKIEYLHGYPSGIYELIKQLDEQYPEVLDKLTTNLKGVFFGSEYPAPVYRDFIEQKLHIPSLSWYGHTEMAVLAFEKNEPFVYYPYQSYGYAEAVEIDGRTHLVGTTIQNKTGPLIRYDTEDIIKPISFNNGLLESFRVLEGRTGEFVKDLRGRKISLTALIFGRHHKLFEFADFIQVKQDTPGKLIVYVTSKRKSLDCTKLFDARGINMSIEFKTVNKPFKTKSGKVSLIVKNQ